MRGFVHHFEYADGDASKISTYNVSPPVRRDWPLPVEIHWTRDTTATAQWVTWSENADFTNAVTQSVPADAASFEIYNLIPDRTYYCKVTTDEGQETADEASATELANFSFKTAGQMRHLKAEGTANVRDLGGWPTSFGRPVKYGKIYRGAEWNGGHNLEPEAIEALRGAGIKAELDLRSDSEAKDITRSVLGSGVSYKRTPLGQTSSHMEGLTNAKNTYKTALRYVLTCVKNERPVYFHCAIGRDRTGTLAFLIEGVLGMSKSDIYKDYELTNFSYFNTPCSKGQLDDMFAMIEALEGETLEQKFATYLTTEFGISKKEIEAFRTAMLGEDDDTAIDISRQTDSQDGNNSSAVYDLSGRKISADANSSLNPHPSTLKKGVYIVNGKKVVTR